MTVSSSRPAAPAARLLSLFFFLALLAVMAGTGPARAQPLTHTPAEPLPEAVVYKHPSCGCCGAWIDHLEAAGFTVEVRDERDMAAVKKRFGVPSRVHSCHTAVIGDYVIEGHVPAEDIRRLLAEQPEAHGLAVPGMPVGSPGMEIGDRSEPYKSWLFSESGMQAWASHGRE